MGVLGVFLIGVLVAQGVSGGVGDDPTSPTALPTWIGTWFATFPTLEGLAFQVAAALFVVGSYLLAEELRYRRPTRRTGPMRAHVTAVTVRESQPPV